MTGKDVGVAKVELDIRLICYASTYPHLKIPSSNGKWIDGFIYTSLILYDWWYCGHDWNKWSRLYLVWGALEKYNVTCPVCFHVF